MEENATNKFFYLEDENHQMAVPFIFADEQEAIKMKDVINKQSEFNFNIIMNYCRTLINVLLKEFDNDTVNKIMKQADMEKPKTIHVVEVQLFDKNEFKNSEYFQKLCE